MKTQAENGLKKLFDFRGQNIDVYDQELFLLKFTGLNEKEGKN